METKKINFNDNFSDFLLEYNNNSQDKLNWINSKLSFIAKTLDEIKNIPDNQYSTNIDGVKNILNDSNIDIFEKIIISLKEINDLVNLPDEDNKLFNVGTLRPILITYIEIAKFVYNEKVASSVVNLITSLAKKL